MTARLILAAADVVGESIQWDDRHGRLVWVDIIGRRIHALDPATGRHRIWPLAGRPTSLGLCADDTAILGMERHLARWDWQGAPEPLCAVEPDLPENRLNEGAVGPDGAYWVGTMQNNIAPDDSPLPMTAAGRLYRYAPEGHLTRVSDDLFGITNTLVWPDAQTLITADTTANAVYRYRIGADGRLSRRRTLLADFPRGLPDGSCMDAEGFVWTARVAGGACLTRMAPDGRIDRVVDLPCRWPTSCTFGGPDMRTLYVTSARFTMSPDYLATAPQEGGLFALSPGVAGLPARRFGQPVPAAAPIHRHARPIGAR